MAQDIRVKEMLPRTAIRGSQDNPPTKESLMTKHNSKRAQSYAIRTAAVLHAVIALFVLLALARMDYTQVQAAAAYMWAFLALLLAVGTFTSDKEEQ